MANTKGEHMKKNIHFHNRLSKCAIVTSNGAYTPNMCIKSAFAQETYRPTREKKTKTTQFTVTSIRPRNHGKHTQKSLISVVPYISEYEKTHRRTNDIK